MDDFPLLIDPPVYYCGFNSPKSYGGNSYFVRHPAGNWLIDSPKFLPRLVAPLRGVGRHRPRLLTHSDDVADARLYAERFGARRYIHRAELHSSRNAEVVLDGEEPVGLAPGFLAIPTPGHTRGHCVLLFEKRVLFTGDHLDWDRHEKRLDASEDYCWYSWPRQTESMRRLAGFSFEWVLPGHGQRVRLPRGRDATAHGGTGRANERRRAVVGRISHPSYDRYPPRPSRLTRAGNAREPAFRQSPGGGSSSE